MFVFAGPVMTTDPVTPVLPSPGITEGESVKLVTQYPEHGPKGGAPSALEPSGQPTPIIPFPDPLGTIASISESLNPVMNPETPPKLTTTPAAEDPKPIPWIATLVPGLP